MWVSFDWPLTRLSEVAGFVRLRDWRPLRWRISEMIVEALIILPEAGVPSLDEMERYEHGMAGLDGTWDWVTGTIDTAIKKISIPGFGTPLVAPGTVIQTAEGVTARQTGGYPIAIPAPPSTRTQTEFSLGTGIMLAGAAVLVGLIAISRGGKKT